MISGVVNHSTCLISRYSQTIPAPVQLTYFTCAHSRLAFCKKAVLQSRQKTKNLFFSFLCAVHALISFYSYWAYSGPWLAGRKDVVRFVIFQVAIFLIGCARVCAQFLHE